MPIHYFFAYAIDILKGVDERMNFNPHSLLEIPTDATTMKQGTDIGVAATKLSYAIYFRLIYITISLNDTVVILPQRLFLLSSYLPPIHILLGFWFRKIFTNHDFNGWNCDDSSIKCGM